MPTLQNVRDHLSNNPGLHQDTTMQCGRINSMLQLDLEQDLNLPVRMVQGTIHSRDPTRPGSTQHLWLELPKGSLSDVQEKIIIDGALDQFTAHNYDTHEDVNTVLNINDTHIPPLIITTKTGEYAHYYTATKPAAE